MTIRLRIVQPPMLIGWKSSGYAGLPPARPAETAARVLDSGPPSLLLSLPSGSEAPIRSSSIMSESFRSGGALVAAPRQPRHGRTTLFTRSRGLGPSLAGLSPRETSAAGRRAAKWRSSTRAARRPAEVFGLSRDRMVISAAAP